MLALSALENWPRKSVDVKTTFLYGKLNEKVHMQQPEWKWSTKVLCLNRAIYRLKQVALAWWKELESSMKRLGFKCTASDAGVFFRYIGGDLIIIIVYVDDAIFFGKNIDTIQKVQKSFMVI